MNEFPLVSIIIPTFNRKKLVNRAVESVLSQTYPYFELIIIDDGSTDNTDISLQTNLPIWKNQLENFGNFQKTIQFHQTEHRGVSAARNFGVSLSTGEWICFLDSDDIWDPIKLTEQIKYHNLHKNIKCSQTNEIWNKKGNILEPKGKFSKLDGMYLEEALESCLVTCSSVMIHRTLWNRLGGFRGELLVCEDYDLWIRIFLLGEPISLISSFLLTRFGGHHDQLSKKYQAIERFRLYSLLSIHEEGTKNKTDGFQIRNVDLQLLRKAIQLRFETVKNGREKRGKDTAFLDQLSKTFAENSPILPKDLLILLDDSLF
ncbi:glycosyltransferase [Leptospira sp. 96542]|nr:glycosyltransferase [Leptospira sp. 96542]